MTSPAQPRGRSSVDLKMTRDSLITHAEWLEMLREQAPWYPQKVTPLRRRPLGASPLHGKEQR